MQIILIISLFLLTNFANTSGEGKAGNEMHQALSTSKITQTTGTDQQQIGELRTASEKTNKQQLIVAQEILNIAITKRMMMLSDGTIHPSYYKEFFKSSFAA